MLSGEDDVRVRRGSEAGLQTPVNNFGLVEATVVLWAGPVGCVRRRVGAGGILWTGQVSLACNFIFLKKFGMCIYSCCICLILVVVIVYLLMLVV